MNKLTKLKLIIVSLAVIASISVFFNFYLIIIQTKSPKQADNTLNQTSDSIDITKEESDDNKNEDSVNEIDEEEKSEVEYIYKYIEGKEKEVIKEKEVVVEKHILDPSSSTDATITYIDSEGNEKTIELPSGTAISFSAGEHGTYDSVPVPITLTDNQELDITDSSYNPSKIEVNYIFKGFSYSGDTMTCMYSLASNTVNVECRQILDSIINNSTVYIKLEYIETSGAQYINTGIEISETALKQNLSIETECAFTDSTIATINQATGKNQNNFFFFGANTSQQFYSGIGPSFTASSKSYNTNFHKHKLEVVNNKGKYYIDNALATDYGTISYVTPDYVGYFHLGDVWAPAGGNVYIAKCKFKRCTCYYKNNLFKDLVSVERASDNVIGMLDLVSGSFLTNAGSGVFNHPDIIDIPARYAGKVIASGSYESGSTLTLTAVPNDGYVFVKWSDGVTSATRPITVENSTVYTALFAPDN